MLYLRLIFSISSREMCVNFFWKIGGKIAIFIFHTSTLPHKNVCRFSVSSKIYLKNTLPKIGDFWGHLRGDIIIYIVYIIFFRRYTPLTLFLCGSVEVWISVFCSELLKNINMFFPEIGWQFWEYFKGCLGCFLLIISLAKRVLCASIAEREVSVVVIINRRIVSRCIVNSYVVSYFNIRNPNQRTWFLIPEILYAIT